MLRKTDVSHAVLSKPLHFGMLICCAVMVAPLAVFFVKGGSVSGLQDSLGVLAPILICLTAHGAMFLVMGKSCHSQKANKDDTPEPNAEVARIVTTDP